MAEPSYEHLILKTIETLDSNFNRRMDRQDDALKDIKASHNEGMNKLDGRIDGVSTRVSKLESARDVHIGRTDWMKWVPATLTGLLITVVGILGTVVIHG